MSKIDGGLRSLYRQHLPDIMWVSIESASTEAGIPDSFYCIPPGRAGWIENKKCAGNPIKIQIGQTAWHERYARMGGRSFVAVRYQNKTVDELLIYPGHNIRMLQLGGRTAGVPVGRFTDGPTKWDWEKVWKILRG